jgi:GNAT superfamily N-acetyltransferase
MKLLKYSLLAALALNGASCLGMERQVTKKIDLHKDYYVCMLNQEFTYFDKALRPTGESFTFFCCDKCTDEPVASADMYHYYIQSQEHMERVADRYEKCYGALFEKYDYEKGPLAELRRFRILDPDLKGKGLGTQFFKKVMECLALYNTKTEICFWKAYPLDGHSKREALLKFYRNCGAHEIKKELAEKIYMSCFDDYKKLILRNKLDWNDDIFYMNLKN